jgi:hypothetical protein
MIDSRLLSLAFGGTIAEPVFTKMFGDTISQVANGSWLPIGGPGIFERESRKRVDELADKLKKRKMTVSDAYGKTSSFFMPNADSPIISQLFNQHDFKDIPAIDTDGCNFLDTLALAQLVTGQSLSRDEVKNIFKTMNREILAPDGTVNDPEALADAVLRKLGRADLGLGFGSANSRGGIQVGSINRMPYLDHYHFTVGGINGQTIYNPGYTNNRIRARMPVYVYKK